MSNGGSGSVASGSVRTFKSKRTVARETLERMADEDPDGTLAPSHRWDDTASDDEDDAPADAHPNGTVRDSRYIYDKGGEIIGKRPVQKAMSQEMRLLLFEAASLGHPTNAYTDDPAGLEGLRRLAGHARRGTDGAADDGSAGSLRTPSDDTVPFDDGDISDVSDDGGKSERTKEPAHGPAGAPPRPHPRHLRAEAPHGPRQR